MFVRQSTARTIIVGPILDSAGAAKTDEVVASVKIHKNGGAAGALDGSATLTHSQTGYYLLALTANDLDTLGCAEFTLNSTTNSMPPRALNVITSDAWDTIHHATDGKLRANVSQWLGTAPQTPTVNGVPIVQMRNSAGSAGINAPLNFEDLSVTDTTGLVALSAAGIDAVVKLKALLDGTPGGSVVDDNDPDPLATAFKTDLTEATNDHYNGAFVVFYSGALTGQSRKISDYDGTTKVLTVATAFTEAPTDGDDFLIIGRSE